MTATDAEVKAALADFQCVKDAAEATEARWQAYCRSTATND